jgi:outer membrane protein assembly factor BamB
VAAEDRPQFRGPNRDSAWNEAGILQTFPADGLKVRWRAPAGRGWSSPVVARGRIYVTDVQLARLAAKERVLCFDEANGRLLWTHQYAWTPPAYANRHIFARNDEELVCASLAAKP